ncbi:MAG TPA: bifunctional phosphoribosyl-AMP cyclohydrolase/phosphoribosyl-ATP diphosphatase HisIE [Candidatus Dormibacteraeota bacterium]|nr:bifunctional phosphoribosyl-AMP cyclohydrolase/phosphoribosyl-ATP diphosphatase HisIE [Candidatus Dormibacteraeota bacterium]
MTLAFPSAARFDDRGLLVAVAQEWVSGRVLMVAFMNREALERTVATGEAHFWSRSRRRLWRKGETSGALLLVDQLQLDCDGDAVLLSVRPQGPTCHLGRRSCFPAPATLSDRLQATLEDRRRLLPSGSYTARLLRGGIPAISRKVGEEATEVIVAAHQDDSTQLVAEVADLWFHTLLLLVAKGLSGDEIRAELAGRLGKPPRERPPDAESAVN